MKVGPKSSLRPFLHGALQLFCLNSPSNGDYWYYLHNTTNRNFADATATLVTFP